MSDFGELAELDVALYRAILVTPNRAVAEFVDPLSDDESNAGAAGGAASRPPVDAAPGAADAADAAGAAGDAGERVGPSVDDLEKAVARLTAMGLVRIGENDTLLAV